MNSAQRIARDLRMRLKTVLAVAGVAVLCVMGVLTAGLGATNAVDRTITIVNADTTTSGPSVTTSTAPVAAPSLKAPAFAGGDWPGFSH